MRRALAGLCVLLLLAAPVAFGAWAEYRFELSHHGRMLWNLLLEREAPHFAVTVRPVDAGESATVEVSVRITHARQLLYPIFIGAPAGFRAIDAQDGAPAPGRVFFADSWDGLDLRGEGRLSLRPTAAHLEDAPLVLQVLHPVDGRVLHEDRAYRLGAQAGRVTVR